jgi:hypothetical protein
VPVSTVDLLFAARVEDGPIVHSVRRYGMFGKKLQKNAVSTQRE